MIRIRKILDDKSLLNKHAIEQIKEILKEQFELLEESDLDKLSLKLSNPVYYQAKATIFVIEGIKNKVKAFALVLHFSDIDICYLEWISTSVSELGRGLGSILYDAIREECKLLNAKGLFLEVLPDVENLCPYDVSLKQNQARVKFYEKYGARVVLNENFKRKILSEKNELLFLIYDSLDSADCQISLKSMKSVVRTILERKYKGQCSPEYIKNVEDSFKDDPVQLREPRYLAKKSISKKVEYEMKPIPLFVNRDHQIHHIREKGYVEAPSRVGVIFKEIEKLKCFKEMQTKNLPEKLLLQVHTKEYIDYLKRVAKAVPEGEVYYPEMFPLRNRTRLPKDVLIQSGYYCQDSFTPIHKNVYKAAFASAECAYSAALYIMSGHRICYALCRPPGHHAESGLFGGFCYINSAAIAAQYLSDFGKVAILDIDFHHGNGTQNIFYKRRDVLTMSIHGNPHDCFPFFSGFDDERGEEDGEGFNINLPLPEKTEFSKYEKVLINALGRIKEFKPEYIVLSLGFDLAQGDPTGTWSFTPENFKSIGNLFKDFHIPLLIVQEGGYHQKNLGMFARSFFEGLVSFTDLEIGKDAKKRARN